MLLVLSIQPLQQQVFTKGHHNGGHHPSLSDVKHALKQLQQEDRARQIRSQPVILPNGSRVALSQLPIETQQSILNSEIGAK